MAARWWLEEIRGPPFTVSILARWRQLQRAGLLPDHARPPMQQDSRDGRPQAGDGDDPLLKKLIEVHGQTKSILRR